MRDLRVVFMGTPDFAVGVLETMLQEEVNVVGVVTSTDKPAGRGRKLRPSAVKQLALKQGLPLLQPPNLKEEAFHAQLAALKANLFVVVAFRMLPKVVWSMPEYGTFNLHASLLPQYRGAAPINWAIINKEKQSGVTTFFIDEQIDSGALILQDTVDIRPSETAGSLHDKLMEVGSKLVIRTIRLIEQGPVRALEQPQAHGLKPAPKLNRDNTRIDWGLPFDNLDAFIRGLNPYPSAWTTLLDNGKEIKTKIFSVQFEKLDRQMELGDVLVADKKIKVAIQDGFAIIDEIQLSGKRKMSAKELLNGFDFSKDAKFV